MSDDTTPTQPIAGRPPEPRPSTPSDSSPSDSSPLPVAPPQVPPASSAEQASPTEQEAAADQEAAVQSPAGPPYAAGEAPVERRSWRGRAYGVRTVAALALASLVLGGLGGAALGAVSGDDDDQRGPGGGFVPGQVGFPDGDRDGDGDGPADFDGQPDGSLEAPSGTTT